MSAKGISVSGVRAALKEGDLREAGRYSAGHPFFAVNNSFSRLEADAPRLIPRRSVRCIRLDGADGFADRAAQILTEMGYHDPCMLEGGGGAYVVQGREPAVQDFGELTESRFDMPSVSAHDLRAMQQQGRDMLILNGRIAPEYTRMTIPGARLCPNAEFGYRLPQMAAPGTPVVVNCAGRTRSIPGAETLRRADGSGPVHALCNGTQGWRDMIWTMDVLRGCRRLCRPKG